MRAGIEASIIEYCAPCFFSSVGFLFSRIYQWKDASLYVIFCCIDDTYEGCWKIVRRRSTIVKICSQIDPEDPVEDILINSSQNDISVTESLLDHAEMILNKSEETIIIISQRYHSFYIYIFYFTQLPNFFFFENVTMF